jgi:hypothetical protein
VFLWLHGVLQIRLCSAWPPLPEVCWEISSPGLADDGQQVVHLELPPFIAANMEEGAILIAFQFHGSFIRFDFGKQVTFFYGSPTFLCQAAITPSVIVSLRRGINITSAMFFSLV